MHLTSFKLSHGNRGRFYLHGERRKKKRPIVFVHILFSLYVSVLNFYPTKFSYVTLNLMRAVLINVDNNREDGAQSRIN